MNIILWAAAVYAAIWVFTAVMADIWIFSVGLDNSPEWVQRGPHIASPFFALTETVSY